MCACWDQALFSCLLVHFAAADLEESRGSTEAARRVYEDLVAGLVPKEDAPPDQAASPQVRACAALMSSVCVIWCVLHGLYMACTWAFASVSPQQRVCAFADLFASASSTFSLPLHCIHMYPDVCRRQSQYDEGLSYIFQVKVDGCHLC